MDFTASPWLFFLCMFISIAIGSVLGSLDRLTSFAPTFYLGWACCGAGELVMSFQGYLPIADTFQVAVGFLIAGALGIGCGSVKLGKALQIQQDQRKAERAAEDARIRQSGATEGVCPNCDAVIALSSRECGDCGAIFGQGSGWEVSPLRRASSQDSPWRV